MHQKRILNFYNIHEHMYTTTTQVLTIYILLYKKKYNFIYFLSCTYMENNVSIIETPIRVKIQNIEKQVLRRSVDGAGWVEKTNFFSFTHFNQLYHSILLYTSSKILYAISRTTTTVTFRVFDVFGESVFAEGKGLIAHEFWCSRPGNVHTAGMTSGRPVERVNIIITLRSRICVHTHTT